MAEDKRRLKVDIEDLLRLAVEFSPEEAKQKILDAYNQIDDLAKSLENTFANPDINGLQGLLEKFDAILAFLNTVTGGELKIFNTFRNLANLLSGGRLNISSLISFFTSFLPAVFPTFLQEAGGFFNTILGAVQFLTSLNPISIAQNLLGGLLSTVLSRLLPGPVLGFLSQIFSGTPLGSLLGGLLGGGGILGGVLNAIFGIFPSTASVKVMDSLSGGFEAPDGIQLSERHKRGTQ